MKKQEAKLKCSYCSKSLTGKEAFCQYCGHKQSVECGKCGHYLSSEKINFCPKCGAETIYYYLHPARQAMQAGNYLLARHRYEKLLEIDPRHPEALEKLAQLKRFEPGGIWTEPYLGMEFVFVPAGTFGMGDMLGEEDDDENSVHPVSLDSFLIGKYPVTFSEYDRFCKETGRRKPDDRGWGRGWRPVIDLSWNDARAFIVWLSSKTGHTFDLPTEAQWEYAARSGGKKEKWAGTSDESCLNDYAWFYENSDKKIHLVGQKKPNGLGIYDMTGNVWEWCRDEWHDNEESRYPYYHSEELWYEDPVDCYFRHKQKIKSDASLRVYRGGCWSSNPRIMHCALRFTRHMDEANPCLGFRLCSLPV